MEFRGVAVTKKEWQCVAPGYAQPLQSGPVRISWVDRARAGIIHLPLPAVTTGAVERKKKDSSLFRSQPQTNLPTNLETSAKER